MSVICFASLKGGVGKTSLAINVAHAFAVRGCRTLLVDFDPSGHSSRFFERSLLKSENDSNGTSPSKVKKNSRTLSQDGSRAQDLPFVRFMLSVDEASDELDGELVSHVRENLDVVFGGPELRHLYFGRGAQNFSKRFLPFLKELRDLYDHIIIDTCPDFNVLTRNALAVSDLAVVPVDASEMSIHSLEELLHSSLHIKRPTWCVVRTMVNKQAKRSQVLSDQRLHARLSMQSPSEDGEDSESRYDIENPHDFMRMLQDWEKEHGSKRGSQVDARPIYLLRSLIYRTEKQNQLSFTGKTAFDTRASAALAEHYLAVARELEVLSGGDGDAVDEGVNEDRSDERDLGGFEALSSH